MKVPVFIQNYLYSLLKSNPVSERLRPDNKDNKKQYNPMHLAYFFEENVSTFADVVQTLRQETFRRGLSWQPRFVQKCTQCGMKYMEKAKTCSCGSVTFTEPNAMQQRLFTRDDGRTFMAQANEDINTPSLKEIIREAHRHLSVSDKAYLLILKNYLQTPAGDIISSRPVEILTIDPRLIQPITQKNDLPGGKYWICLQHRTNIEEKPDQVCKICGKKLYEAYFETGDKKLFIKDEVKLLTLYNAGAPPIIKLAEEAYSLFYLGRRTRSSYEEGHGRGMLVFPTANPASFYTFWEKSLQMWKEDPNEIQVTTFDAGQGKGKPELIKFLDDPNPEQIQVKTDLRNRIMSYFGVSPLFMADTSASGGLNNEGQQITVTNRAVEFNQGVWGGDKETFYEDGALTWVCDQFGITDYTIQPNPSEEQDEMEEKTRFAQDAQNAKLMLDMGFDVQFEDNKFIFSGQAKKPEPAFNPLATAGPAAQPQDARVSGEPIGKADIKKESDELDEYNNDQLIKAHASDAIRAIRAGALYSFYKDIPPEDIPKIHEIIRQAFLEKRLHLQEMTDAIAALGIDPEKARMIARTESTGVAMRAREIGWKQLETTRPEEEFVYKPVITNDYRTSPVSRRIKAAVDAEGGAVSLDRLKEIYKEESTKPYIKGDPENSGMGPGWTGWENFVGHPYERDSIVRVI